MAYSFNSAKLPPLSAEDAEFLRSMDSARDVAIRSYFQAIESELVKRLKALLGDIPSPEEMRKHSLCGIFPDGTREFKWKGETILRVTPIFKGITPPTPIF